MIETREFVQFGNEDFTKSFVSAAVRDLDKNFVALSEKKLEIKISSSDGSSRKLFLVFT